MAKESNYYEEARRLRVQENLKHLEGLGISKISKGLFEVAKCKYKLLKCRASPKSKKNLEMMDLRRSSRARNPVSYQEMHQDEDTVRRSYRRRYSRSGSSGRVDDGRIASYEERVRAEERAEKLQSDLKLSHPSFVKSMVRSHVSSCFWLALPSKFCKEHLPPNELKMVLEDEKGLEYDAIYIGSRTGLSGGWRGFAMDHNLEDGDVLVFELSEPDRFKVYIIKAVEEQLSQDNDGNITDADIEGTTTPVKEFKSVKEKDLSVSQKPTPKIGLMRRTKSAAKRSPLT